MGGIAAYEESRFRRHKYNAFVMRFTDQVPSQAGFGLGDEHRSSASAARERLPQPSNLAIVRRLKARHTFEQGRLAGAVRSNDAQHLALVDVEGDVHQGDLLAVELRQLPNL